MSTTASTAFQCPAGSNFVDTYGGLYGPAGAYPVQDPACPSGYDILQSTLQFQCARCAPGTYSVTPSTTTGAPNSTVAQLCRPCPLGGQCGADGGVVATPGYWGGANGDGTVTLVLCPTGYCCDGDDDASSVWPCAAIGVCGGNRVGRLCGDCRPGYVESIGSPVCVPVGQCADDRPVLWTVGAVGVLLAALVQLVLVSDVWLPAQRFPSGKMKLAVYFFQVSVEGLGRY